jgi:hypothetical protein
MGAQGIPVASRGVGVGGLRRGAGGKPRKSMMCRPRAPFCETGRTISYGKHPFAQAPRHGVLCGKAHVPVYSLPPAWVFLLMGKPGDWCSVIVETHS